MDPFGTILVVTTVAGLATGLRALSTVLTQVVGSVFGFALVGVPQGVFPVAAGFAAGAMLAVVLREMGPSTHGHDYADAATAAFLVGFVLLVVVDAVITVYPVTTVHRGRTGRGAIFSVTW